MEQIAVIRCRFPKGPFTLRLPCDLYSPEQVQDEAERMRREGATSVTVDIEVREELPESPELEEVLSFVAGGDTDAVATEWELNPDSRKDMVASLVAEAKEIWGMTVSPEAIAAFFDHYISGRPLVNG